MADPARARSVFDWFDELCDLPADERRRRLRIVESTDVELAAELAALLEHDRDAPRFLRKLSDALASAASPDAAARGDAAQPPLPERIGRYPILAKIGEGGMGLVYRARQEAPLRDVALKVLRPGLASADAIRRFTSESDLAGRLDHPNIARIHEASSAELNGETIFFFVMELIEGRPLLEHVAASRLDVPGRLELFLDLCAAVEHAHPTGVIHRDLKSANALVTSDGAVKVLDFGLARTLDPGLQTTLARAETGRILGTVPSMSPEQLAGDPSALDVRLDVYALGVVLFELLAGRLPYPSSGVALPELVRRIQQDDAPRLSSVARELRGDLDWIVAKALAKERERRYASVRDLAADVRRHLDHVPVSARAPSLPYLAVKFARRHRGLAAGSVIAGAALIAGTAGVLHFAFDASRSAAEAKELAGKERTARNQADRALAESTAARAAEAREARKRAAIDGFLMQRVFGALDGDLALGPEVTMRMALDVAARSIATERFEFPEIELSVRVVMADAYLEIGAYESAERQADAALTLASAIPAAAVVEEIERAWYVRGHALRARGDAAGAVAAFARLEALRSDRLGSEHAETRMARAVAARAALDAGDFGPARAIVAEWSIDRVRDWRPDPQCGAAEAPDVAMLLELLEQHEVALALEDRLIDHARAAYGERHPRLARALSRKAECLRELDRSAEREPLLREAISILEESLGPEHPALAAPLGKLASAVESIDEKQQLNTRAMALAERGSGRMNNDFAQYLAQDGIFLRRRGELAAARARYDEALAILEKLHPTGHAQVADVLHNIGTLCFTQKEWVAAREHHERALEMRRRLVGPDSEAVLTSLQNLATIALSANEFERCEARNQEILALLDRRGEGRARDAGLAWRRDARLRWLRKELPEAERSARHALELLRGASAEKDGEIASAVDLLATLLVDGGDPAAAITAFEESLQRLRADPAPPAARVTTLEAQLVKLRAQLPAAAGSGD